MREAPHRDKHAVRGRKVCYASTGNAMEPLTADALFQRYFWPHYPPDVRAAPGEAMDRDANPARNPHLVAHLVDAAELFVQHAPRLLGTALTFDGDGVARLAHALDRSRRDALLAASTPGDPGSPFFNAVVHGAAFVGETVVRGHGGAWSMRRPMWESLVVRQGHAVGAIPPFHWLLKHLSDDEIDQGSLAYRFRVHVELATADIDAWPVIAPTRALPVLKAPTYDLLVKYLHQHLPAVRDVGEAFPSPQEFTERRYASLAFQSMHGGRVLALHGQVPPQGEAPSRIEVLWLRATGLDHIDSVPADASPPYFGRGVGDALEITVAWNGRPHTHRIGFRGHG